MRRILALFLLVLASAPAAASGNPGYPCFVLRGCIEESTPTHDIGRGATITLPQGWTYYSYPPAPVPEMAGLREARAFKDGVVIVISPLPNIDRRATPEAMLRDLNAQGAAQYLPASAERSHHFVSMSRGDLVGGYASFTAAQPGVRPFKVVPNRSFASVTTFLFSYRFVIFAVSVASERLPDDVYAEAVNAILNVQ